MNPSLLTKVVADTVWSVYKAGLDFAADLSDEWREQYLLSVLAQALVYTSFESIGPHGRWWFFRLAARAGAKFMEYRKVSAGKSPQLIHRPKLNVVEPTNTSDTPAHGEGTQTSSHSRTPKDEHCPQGQSNASIGVPRHRMNLDAWFQDWYQQHFTLPRLMNFFQHREDYIELVMRVLDEDERFLYFAPCNASRSILGINASIPALANIIVSSRCLRIVDTDQNFQPTQTIAIDYADIRRIVPHLRHRIGVILTGDLDIITDGDMYYVKGILRKQTQGVLNAIRVVMGDSIDYSA